VGAAGLERHPGEVLDPVLPEVPDWLRDAPSVTVEPPTCGCGREVFPGPDEVEPELFSRTRSPRLLADRFAAQWLLVQQHTARMWQAAAAMHAASGARSAEFVGDPTSSAYRVPRRLRQHLERRDRTCTFPGCTVPGHQCDIDHRELWPYGPTIETNCHCLCRRHHRAKQCYFTVELDPHTGDTLWTTPDGRQYSRRPPTC
jgi:hypothetical protein